MNSIENEIVYSIDSKFIIADEEHRNIYDRMMKLTNAHSTWSILEGFELFIDCKLMIKENKLYYYVNKIEGNLGYEDLYNRSGIISPFVIKVYQQELVVIEGDLSTLEKVLNKLSQDKTFEVGYPLVYEKNDSPYVADDINNWAMKGCPDIGVSYQIHISSLVKKGELYKLNIMNISYDEINLDLTGVVKKQLCLKCNKTGDEWTFTSSPNYASVKTSPSGNLVSSSCVYRPMKQQHRDYITPLLRDRAEKLIQIIQYKLQSI